MFNNNFKLSLFSYQLICVLIFVNQNRSSAEHRCGIPGRTLKSSIKTHFNNEKIVDNGIKVKYTCDYNDAPFIIGHNQRECKDGEWDQPMPKCASLYTSKYDIDYTPNGNAINISLASSAKISGLVVKVSSLEPIEVVNIKHIPSPGCFVANSTFKDKVPFHLTKRYSTLFHCPTKDSNFESHEKVAWILITFNEKFKNCELISCPAILEFIELYEANSDECFRPDVPAFGKLTPIKTNKTSIKFNYQCENFFTMKERRATEIVCLPNNEWSLKKLPKCVPNITCEIEPSDELKVSYNWLWSDSEAVVGTVATFECAQNSTKINGTLKRECLSDGSWSEELPRCIPVTTTTTTTETTELTTELTISSSTQSEHVNDESIDTTSPDAKPDPLPKPYITKATENSYYPPMVRTTTPIPQPSLGQSSDSIKLIHLTYIFLGVLMGILITICVIYYFQRKRRNSYANQSDNTTKSGRNQRLPRNEVYYDHINPSTSDSRMSNPCLDTESGDDGQLYPCDSAGYIQIEAVESMRMNTFRKYENFDNSRKYSKPLPQVPK